MEKTKEDGRRACVCRGNNRSLRWGGYGRPTQQGLEGGEGVSHAARRGRRLQGTGLASARALGGNILMCSKFRKEARGVEQ